MSYVQANDIFLMRAVNNSDLPNNGGRMSESQAVGGSKNNVWPDVGPEERLIGSISYRKVFVRNANALNLTLGNAKIFISQITPGNDRVLIFSGSQTDVQSAFLSTLRQYGGGQLAANMAVGATTLSVSCENGADNIFLFGDLIRIANGVTVEFKRITAVTINADIASITINSGVGAGYLASNTLVSSCIEAGDLKCETTSYVKSAAVGTFNNTVFPVLCSNLGTVEQTVIVTFSSPTAFYVSGSTLGALGNGTIGSNFVVTNPKYSAPYFTIQSAMWGGTWAANDSLTFDTHPSAYPIWEKRIVPPEAGSLSGNSMSLGIFGDG